MEDVTVTIKQEPEDDYYSGQCGQYEDNDQVSTPLSDHTPAHSGPSLILSLAPSSSKVVRPPSDLPYTCHTCRFETSEPDVHQNHANLHIHPQPVCDICMLELEDFDCLQTHRLLHFNSSLVCYACDVTFVASTPNPEQSVAYQGLLHLSSIHGEKNLSSECHVVMYCPVCQQRFSDSKAFIYHMCMHAVAEVNNYFCKFCGLQFIGRRALQAHFSGPRHMEMKKKLADVFVCAECRVIFPNRDSYAMHQLQRAQEESCVGSRKAPTSICCPICEPTPVLLKTVQEFEAHLQNKHVPPAPAVDTGKRGGQPMICKTCGEKLKDLDALMLHMFEHKAPNSQPGQKGKEPEAVEEKISTAQSTSLTIPVTTASQGEVDQQVPLLLRLQDELYCKFCAGRFDCKDSLAMHVMTDHSEDMYSGDIKSSPRSSSSSSSISYLAGGSSAGYNSLTKMNDEFAAPGTVSQQRADMHRGNMQVCGQCGMIFTSLDALAMHMMTHAHHDMEDVEKERRQRGEGHSLWNSKEPMQPQVKRLRAASASIAGDALPLHIKRTRPASASMVEDMSVGASLRKVSSPHKAVPPKCPASLQSHPAFSEPVNFAHHSRALSLVPSASNKSAHTYEKSHTPSSVHVPATRSARSDCSTPLSETAQMNPDTTHGEASPSTSGETSSIVDFVLENRESLKMCRHCKIVFAEKTLYYLHMGLHNLNNAWQCNLCGRICRDAREFSAHVIHF
ncbi:zinc finger protein 423 [Lingula anatina]|uniref:Zinc finger protein 423 n=1 Tax=Lingula anatina TaxID=7574 RepID=A0A1S3KDL6_LINAN|nr:zinc finger protein 423 [Lingula anatina]|eukprot:XP_013420718.1 zinc finger protein 423 [Lingula anatina]